MALDPYQTVKTLRPGRSAFDLSHDVKTTCDLGQLIPFMAELVVPGDHWTVGIEAVIRMMPMVAPILHKIDAFFDLFFIPFRLLDSNWEMFRTGGADGANAYTLPKWAPTNTALGSLWDYLGFPTGVDPVGLRPLDYVRQAYNLVYNQYYRDETQIAEVALTNETILNCAWRKDYFTSALPWQQRGTAPALPVTGSAVWDPSLILNTDFDASSTPPRFRFDTINGIMYIFKSGDNDPRDNARQFMNSNTVNLTTFNVADLRLALRLQELLERNARAGARYTEWLGAHFNVKAQDFRLQRAEFVGGCQFGVNISEVLQTSASTLASSTPQGTMAGHGLTAGSDLMGKYSAQEDGILLGIMRIKPVAAYSQGMPRMFTQTSRYDFYVPELAHLAEQAVLRGEIYADGNSTNNNTIFGYQGRFNELRSRSSMLTNLMRVGVAGTLDYWHLGRNFSSAPALNQAFIECVPTKRYLAAPSQPACIVNLGVMARAVRPLPYEPTPLT